MENITNTNKVHKFDLFDKIYISILFFSANIFASPLFSYVPVGGIIMHRLMLIIFTSMLILAWFLKPFEKNINRHIIYLCLFFILCQIIYGIYFQSIRAITLNWVTLFVIFLMLFFGDMNAQHNKYIDKFIALSTGFMIILIIGAYIGFFYHFFGGEELLHIYNPDGRPNRLFLTTFSNANIGNFIRPGGIYDEPGALSFFICSISLLRVIYKKKNTVTVFLLISGMITFSLTHLMVIMCYFAHWAINAYRKKSFAVTLFLIIMSVAGTYIAFKDVFDNLLIGRFNTIDVIINNNRMIQIPNVINNLDTRTLFFGRMGYHDFCFFEVTRYIGGDISSNPLTPVISVGLIASLIFYVFLCVVLFAALLKIKYFFIYFAILLLYLQRPFFATLGYSLYLMLFFLISLNYISNNISFLTLKNKETSCTQAVCENKA